VSTAQETHCWQTELGPSTVPALAHHRVQDAIVFPGAGYIEMARSAAREIWPEAEAIEIGDLRFQEALVFPAAGAVTTQVTLTIFGAGLAEFRCSSRSGAAWILHATGLVTVVSAVAPVVALDPIRARCAASIDPQELYRSFASRGLHYSNAFCGIVGLYRAEGEALAELRPPRRCPKSKAMPSSRWLSIPS
jgi:acyl transferase domain-containing protein